MLRRSGLPAAAFAAVAFLAACAAPPAPAPDMRAQDTAAMVAADESWLQAAKTRGAAGWMSYYTDDVAILPPGSPAIVGREAVGKYVAAMFATPGFALDWKATSAEVARSGDIGYVRGTYNAAWRDKRGKTVKETGKFVEIWRKQADGSWKCAVDMWSADKG
jgi:ketosteroid isomerase-like protein